MCAHVTIERQVMVAIFADISVFHKCKPLVLLHILIRRNYQPDLATFGEAQHMFPNQPHRSSYRNIPPVQCSQVLGGSPRKQWQVNQSPVPIFECQSGVLARDCVDLSEEMGGDRARTSEDITVLALKLPIADQKPKPFLPERLR